MTPYEKKILYNYKALNYLKISSILNKIKLSTEEFVDLFSIYDNLDNDLNILLCKSQFDIVKTLPENEIIKIVKNSEFKQSFGLNLLLLNNQNVTPSHKWLDVLRELPSVIKGGLKIDKLNLLNKLISLSVMSLDDINSKEELSEKLIEYLDTFSTFREENIIAVYRATENMTDKFQKTIDRLNAREYVNKKVKDWLVDKSSQEYFQKVDFDEFDIAKVQLAPCLINSVFAGQDLDKILSSQILHIADYVEQSPNNQTLKLFCNGWWNDRWVELVNKARNAELEHKEVLEFSIIAEKICSSLASGRLNPNMPDFLFPLIKGVAENVLFGNFDENEKQMFIDNVCMYNIEINEKKINNVKIENWEWNRSFVRMMVAYLTKQKTGDFVDVSCVCQGLGNFQGAFCRDIRLLDSDLQLIEKSYQFTLDKISNFTSVVNHEIYHYCQDKFSDNDQASNASIISKIGLTCRKELQKYLKSDNKDLKFKHDYKCNLSEFEAFHVGFLSQLQMFQRLDYYSRLSIENYNDMIRNFMITDIVDHFNASRKVLDFDIGLIKKLFDLYSQKPTNPEIKFLHDKILTIGFTEKELITKLNMAEQYIHSDAMLKDYEEKYFMPLKNTMAKFNYNPNYLDSEYYSSKNQMSNRLDYLDLYNECLDNLAAKELIQSRME